MKHIFKCFAWCVTLCLSQQLFSQSTGIPFTAEYVVTPDISHTLETDNQGNVTKALNVVTGTGTHSILGKVSTISLVHFDTSNGDNLIDFTETDSEGNSMFVKTKGSPHKAGWKCYGTIVGGTGKYKTATGSYTAVGTSDETGSTWTAEGILFYTSEEDEIATIKKVIKAETQAYMNKDLKAYHDSYLKADYTTLVNNVPEGTANMIYPYENNQSKASDQELMDAHIPFTDVVSSDWNIQLRGDIAWATFNQKLNALGKRFPSVETRILEKINDKWKITHASSVYNSKTAVPLSSSNND